MAIAPVSGYSVGTPVSYRLLDQTTTPDGEPLELAIERGSYVLRIGGRLLMSSACHGSERAMAHLAAEILGELPAARVLVGGLGMGHTLRAALDAFGRGARVTVAELLPAVVRYNQGPLAHLAGRPLRDRRVTLFEGDVRVAIDDGPWDAILLDVDNGPDAMVVGDNTHLYGREGSARLAAALRPGGVAIVWAGYPSRAYERTLSEAGLVVSSHRVRARWPLRKGATHVLFVAQRPPASARAPADALDAARQAADSAAELAGSDIVGFAIAGSEVVGSALAGSEMAGLDADSPRQRRRERARPPRGRRSSRTRRR